MSVTKEITRLDKSNVRLSLTVPKDDVLSQYQDLLKDYAKSIQIPGFRKGKAPQDVIERKIGEALKGEAMGRIMEKAIGEIFEEGNLPKDERPLPYSQPEMEEEPKLDFGQDLCFSLVYDVIPKVTIGQWKGLEAEVPEVSITDEDIARELEELRDRNAFVLDREDGCDARHGDVVTLDYCELADENGGELPNTNREDFVFTLGSAQNAYGFDDEITGMKKGETKEFTKVYPEDDKTPFAGRTIKLRVTVTAIKEKRLPDLDDELAQDIDEKYNTLDDLKNNIRERLEKTLENRLKEIKTSNLLEKIMENTPITLPESMVRVELDGRLRNLARNFGTDTDRILQMLSQTGDGLENIEEKWRPSAEKALRSRLIVETLTEEQNIEVGEDEIEKEMERIAADVGMPLEDVKKRYSEGGAQEYIKEEIRERKVFDLLFTENTVKTGTKMSYLDLMTNNG